MRPSLILSIITPLILAGGATCLALELRHVALLAYPSHVDLLTSTLLAVGSACAMLWIAVVRGQCRKFARAVHQMIEQKTLHPVECDNPILVPLMRGMNNLVDLAEFSMSQAAENVKEMEIQLKVIAAERHDAQAILHSISDAVLVTDPFDELVMANETAARLFQFDQETSCGNPVDRIVKDPKIIEFIRDMRQSRSSARRVVEYAIAEPAAAVPGKVPPPTRTFKITLSCVARRPDAPSGVVAVLHDMTREKEVAQMKSEFVSNVSHELRTPLASIKAYVEMLIDGEAEDEKTTREFHEVIQNEANRLSRLIDNILSISRIESGLVQVNKHPQSLTVILKEAIEVITPQARSKQITLVEKLTPVFYQTIADKDLLYQAVLNLLSNAVKYTPQGGTVSIETLVDEAGRRVKTRISDSGAGIPAKDMPRVFDKFFRSEANSHMAKGTGLGLSLVKNIIENVHKGRLTLESEVGKGSCFGFELELA